MADNIMETVAELRRLMAAATPQPWHEESHIQDHRFYGRDMRGCDWKLAGRAINALPALLDYIEGCERSYDYAAKSWAEERARLNERIAKLEAGRG